LKTNIFFNKSFFVEGCCKFESHYSNPLLIGFFIAMSKHHESSTNPMISNDHSIVDEKDKEDVSKGQEVEEEKEDNDGAAQDNESDNDERSEACQPENQPTDGDVSEEEELEVIDTPKMIDTQKVNQPKANKPEDRFVSRRLRSKSPPPRKRSSRSRSPTPPTRQKTRRSRSRSRSRSKTITKKRDPVEDARQAVIGTRQRSPPRSRDHHHHHQGRTSRVTFRREEKSASSQGRQRESALPSSPSSSFNNNNNSQSALDLRCLDPEKIMKFRSFQVIILSANPHEEGRWKPIFQRLGYQIYDFLYPFRNASRMILRQNSGYRQESIFASLDCEPLANFLSQQVSGFMSGRYKSNFIYDYFDDWFKKNRPSRVVICGFSMQDYGSKMAIDKLKSLGALQVGGQDVPFGDVNVTTSNDLEKFLRYI
jgi:hypothetical protein